ncbi:MAG: DUF559 domain-containing protein [Planctomycetia bacterium]|nr:DUF559 domain-containing protein [Planctomycetia bacterium]
MDEKKQKLQKYARELRKNMTKEEKHLWYDALRKYPVHWYRQYLIGSYIVDFYCAKAKLVVELDGSQHRTDEGKFYDQERTLFLNQEGIEVLRFRNETVHQKFFWVSAVIRGRVKERMKEFGLDFENLPERGRR